MVTVTWAGCEPKECSCFVKLTQLFTQFACFSPPFGNPVNIFPSQQIATHVANAQHVSTESSKLDFDSDRSMVPVHNQTLHSGKPT